MPFALAVSSATGGGIFTAASAAEVVPRWNTTAARASAPPQPARVAASRGKREEAFMVGLVKEGCRLVGVGSGALQHPAAAGRAPAQPMPSGRSRPRNAPSAASGRCSSSTGSACGRSLAPARAPPRCRRPGPSRSRRRTRAPPNGPRASSRRSGRRRAGCRRCRAGSRRGQQHPVGQLVVAARFRIGGQRHSTSPATCFSSGQPLTPIVSSKSAQAEHVVAAQARPRRPAAGSRGCRAAARCRARRRPRSPARGRAGSAGSRRLAPALDLAGAKRARVGAVGRRAVGVASAGSR